MPRKIDCKFYTLRLKTVLGHVLALVCIFEHIRETKTCETSYFIW